VATDPFVRLMLRQVDRAENWKEARDRLYELHRLLYEDVTLLPLWQMIDFFAYHRGLRGVQDRPISFYQDVEKWRIVPPAVQD
jgi:ABC-type oligopeptide transport system substrate-binding subunit